MHVLDGCRDRRTAEKAGDSLERWFVFVYTRIKYEIESCAFTMLHMQTWKWWVEPSKARVRLVRAFCWSSTLADVSTHRRVTSFHLSAGSYLQRQCGVHTVVAFLSFCFARVSKGLASHPVVCIFWSNQSYCTCAKAGTGLHGLPERAGMCCSATGWQLFHPAFRGGCCHITNVPVTTCCVQRQQVCAPCLLHKQRANAVCPCQTTT